MRTYERSCGDVVILDLHGTLAARAVDVDLWEKLTDLSRRGHHKFILNMAGASSSRAFGISTLLGALLTARRDGGELKLLNITRHIDDLQILVALYDHFEVFDSEQEAVESFGPAPALVAQRVGLRRADVGNVVARGRLRATT